MPPMKKHLLLLSLLLSVVPSGLQAAVTPEEAANTVILDETGEKNLKIETVEVEEIDFEETAFALGRIEVLPGNSAIVSTRIPGRVHSLLARPHVETQQGDELLWIESRQPGDPPPVIKITAPISGLISQVNVAVGQPVTPDTSLIEILDLDTVEAAAAVPEHLAGKLKAGQTAHIRAHAAGDKVFESTMVHLGTHADSASGTLEAAFHVPNPEHLLRPGMRAEFSIVLGKREGVMSIPRIALQGDVTSRVVYRRHYDESLKHTFVRIPVQVGAMNDQSVEITSGLLAGDEVVTIGAYSLGFAGKGSVSLKAALDAAHGHEHNEDGSEVTPDQKAKRAAAGAGDGHDHGGENSSLTIFSLITNGLLLVLLVTAMRRKPKADEPALETPNPGVR